MEASQGIQSAEGSRSPLGVDVELRIARYQGTGSKRKTFNIDSGNAAQGLYRCEARIPRRHNHKTSSDADRRLCPVKIPRASDRTTQGLKNEEGEKMNEENETSEVGIRNGVRDLVNAWKGHCGDCMLTTSQLINGLEELVKEDCTSDPTDERDAIGRVVYLAHPVRGDVEVNLAKAKAWLKYYSENNPEIAFVAQWIVECELWDDADPASREQGLKRCLALVERCDELWCIGESITAGMQRELEQACAFGIPVLDLTGGQLLHEGKLYEPLLSGYLLPVDLLVDEYGSRYHPSWMIAAPVVNMKGCLCYREIGVTEGETVDPGPRAPTGIDPRPEFATAEECKQVAVDELLRSCVRCKAPSGERELCIGCLKSRYGETAEFASKIERIPQELRDMSGVPSEVRNCPPKADQSELEVQLKVMTEDRDELRQQLKQLEESRCEDCKVPIERGTSVLFVPELGAPCRAICQACANRILTASTGSLLGKVAL